MAGWSRSILSTRVPLRRSARRWDGSRTKAPELGPITAGEPLVWYLGDDSRNEYIYKFVSNEVWSPRDANGGLAAGDKYLDDGKLYVAQFLPDGTGQWIELTFRQERHHAGVSAVLVR